MYSVKPVFFFFIPPLYFRVMHCSSTSGCLYKANMMRERESFPNLTHSSSPLSVCRETEACERMNVHSSSSPRYLKPPLDGQTAVALTVLIPFAFSLPPPGTFECCSYLKAHLPRCFNVDCCIMHLFSLLLTHTSLLSE